MSTQIAKIYEIPLDKCSGKYIQATTFCGPESILEYSTTCKKVDILIRGENGYESVALTKNQAILLADSILQAYKDE